MKELFSKSDLRRLTTTQCHTGENPLWHPSEKVLYWCDIPAGHLYRYNPADASCTLVRNGAEHGGMIGGFTIENDGALLLFMGEGQVARWTPQTFEIVVPASKADIGYRYNDVIADPAGRVFCGTLSYADLSGALYRLDPGGERTLIMDHVGCSNGLAFSNDRKRLFYTDSTNQVIYVFAYDVAGGLSERKVFIKTDPADGMPDGLTIDAQDRLWSAHWDGACVLCYSPEGKEIARLPIPTRKATSLTFGGEDLSTLFITTSGGDSPGLNGEYAGSLFSIQTGTAGVPEFRSKIGR